jgi:hypothetical protein
MRPKLLHRRSGAKLKSYATHRRLEDYSSLGSRRGSK